MNITVDAQGRITSAESAASNIPPSYINGLEMTKVDASTISVSDGLAKSSDNSTEITLTGSGGLTNIDFTSATGLNSVEALPLEDAWYSIWVVTDGTSTGLKAVKGSTEPAGYLAERRIGWVRVNSSLQVRDFACTRSSNTVNECANTPIVYNITAGSAATGLMDISSSVPPNTKIADIYIMNRNQSTTLSWVNAAHYFSNDSTITTRTKAGNGTYKTSASGKVFLTYQLPLLLN